MKIQPKHIVDCDVLLIGGGLAGCVAAITARELGIPRVILVDKGKVSRSGQSVFAAGIWALNLPGESLDTWMEETITTGDYWNDQAWVKLLWERNHQIAQMVDSWCLESGRQAFLKSEDGNYLRRKNRGHIKTSHGTVQSVSMMEGLRRKAMAVGVELMERIMITDLVCPEGVCTGATGFNYRTGETYLFQAAQTIAAAAGTAFKSAYVGHRNLTGDLLAAVWRAGGTLQNMENVTYNTTARIMDVHGMNQFQSIGGKWVNRLNEEFMPVYDPVLGNRCSQPVMSLALAHEVHQGRGPIMFDVTAASSEDQEYCRQTLGESFHIWELAGINPFKEKVEWVTAFYGTTNNGGGVSIDLNCATDIPHLYAVGDITPVPPHGGYSFGGVNLAFAAVSGRIAGEAVYGSTFTALNSTNKDQSVRLSIEQLTGTFRPLAGGNITPDEIIREIQSALFPYRTSLIKNRTNLEQCLRTLEDIEDKLEGLAANDLHELVKANETRNLSEIARLIIQASLLRKESRGFHFREDFPVTDNLNWLRWIKVKNQDGQACWRMEDVPTPFLKPPITYYRHRSLPQDVTPDAEVFNCGS